MSVWKQQLYWIEYGEDKPLGEKPKRDWTWYADSVCALLLALCPLLQHYVGPLYNMAISALGLIAVYLIYRLLPEVRNFKLSKIWFVLPMIVYQVYRAINHGTTVTEVGQSGVFIIFMIAVAMGKIDVRKMIRLAQIVALVASTCILIQYICFYIFGFHLQFVATSLLIPAAEQWILGAQTGLAGVTGRMGNFYRPSAFFLEPSHVYIYCFPHLILMLFQRKINKVALMEAILLSLGIMGTTSGMGIAAAMCIWGLFLILRDERDGSFSMKNIFRKRNLIAAAILVIVFLVAVNNIPFLSQAVKRIFVPGKTGSTAISGRTMRALKLINKMDFKQWIVGVADNTHGFSYTIPGAMDVLYRHGLIGLVLSYELYVKCIFKLKFSYRFVGIVILITSLFTGHTHSTVGMLNYLMILMSGFAYVDCKHRPIRVYHPEAVSGGRYLKKENR